ncbi:DegT/DnrJ/EryC1/StrS family aminotransferase [Jannaschia sp. Os4]|uniref:DegT/DnrJ/EryC1/StrS family aminotransferase n=1 Tax=Jannaschia sp. Os4 TaxID=2807617 RepID=UPI001939A805|nr:DegT/DnrJ/EryC1/StrS family aminotransferase [Jannaschia sp. Os4]MBM2576118.1 DegT/DnrJ/EryC1/StrS family aminotransferase [Jannaschia sp. Os4]
MERFDKSFTRQEPIPDDAIAAAVEVMRSGALHRYGADPSQVAALESEFAASVGSRYCVAVASGGYAMRAALAALGVGPGDPVLTNGWTLAPVPGAIAALGARPVLVETTGRLVIDLRDLAGKLDRAKVLLLSHMRGHLADMPALTRLCDDAGVAVVEDCAHTMGADWDGRPSGTWGAVGCYSTQTYKHVNAGEGGLAVTDDADLAAKMVLLSGSYMLYERHGAAPDASVFERHRDVVPNVSGRMDELRAAILRPQVAALPARREAWNLRYRLLEDGLRDAPGLAVVPRPQAEGYVGSSIQVLADDPARVPGFVAGCAARGVEWKWFGGDRAVGFTSAHRHWGYVAPQDLPRTDAVLARLLDMRVPLTFDAADCAAIGRIVREEAARTLA